MIQCDTPIQHYTSVFCPCSFSTSLVSPSFVCFFLHFFRLSFFSPLWLCHPSLYLSSGWRCSSRLSGLFDFLVLALICSDTSPTRYFRIFFFSFLFQLLRSNLLFCSSPTFSFILLLLLTIVPSLFFLASLNVPSHLLCCLFFKYHICYAFQSSSSSSESKQIATWYMTKDSLRPPKTPPTLSLHSQSLQPLPPGFRNHGVRTKFIWIGYGCRNPIKVDWWPFLNIST